METTLDCELCIVGAGYAALNGLNAAAKYLKIADRVVVIDKNRTWGGNWLDQYEFVRLHQPYRLFTAGDQPWKLARERSHLATRNEVISHFATVPQVSAGHLEVVPLFGHSYQGHRLNEGGVEIDTTSAAAGGGPGVTTRVRARRLLKLTGNDIKPLPPYPLSSARVRSVGAADRVLTTAEFLDDDSPVYVIGGGKTAMDCVRHVQQHGRARDRAVDVVGGSGMWFMVRDTLFPTGQRRYLRGELTGDFLLRMAKLFDGQNEHEVMAELEKQRIVTNPFGYGGNFRFGSLSWSELEELVRGTREVHRGHLVDVDGNRMLLRDESGRREVQVPDGAWFINCTSHLHAIPHEPLLQDGGAVCAPQFAVGFSGSSAYLITHLWFQDELTSLAPELFRVRLDVEPKLRFGPQLALMMMANLSLIIPRLPLSVILNYQGDFNKWFPPYRQVPLFARMRTGSDEMQRKAERILRMRYSDQSL